MAPIFSVWIRGKVFIDGYTQHGSKRNDSDNPNVNDAKIMVNLVGFRNDGPLMLLSGKQAGGSQIRGLGFFNRDLEPYFGHQRSGIEVRDANFVNINGCVFGGIDQARLTRGVVINRGNHNTVGGSLYPTVNPALQNVMRTYNVGVELAGDSKHNAITNNLIGGEPEQFADPIQKVGVLIRPQSENDTIESNVLFKNIKALELETTNTIGKHNTIVPR